MRLAHMTHETVHWVVCRAIDLEEVFTLQGHRDTFMLTNAAMAYAGFGWVAWDDEQPVAVFGAVPVHAGVWNCFLMATPQFPRVMLGVTRFLKRIAGPKLFGELGAHRVQCDLHERHSFVHRWAETSLGMWRESVKENYGPDGSDYYHYVLSKPLDRKTRQE